jgi:L-ribulose-5-phosphate 4-epimerase
VLDILKKEVFEANMELMKQGLIIYTWGNVSGFDPTTQRVVIKPSGVSYDVMKQEDMVVVDLNGTIVEGHLNPSSDTNTHLALYRAFPNLRGICHTHSVYAVSHAQAQLDVKPFGTTHADYFYGTIKCTRTLKDDEIMQDYELNTGKVIIETFHQHHETPYEIPAILVGHHGPFTFGKSPKESVMHAKVLEEVCKMNTYMHQINPHATPVTQSLLNKHYLRKHGNDAYYGQKK